MNVCYLSNQYPKVSHTFIRREILALEGLGVNVLRVSARISAEGLVDALDKEELSKTHSIAQGKLLQLFLFFLKQFLSAPILTFKAIFFSVKLGLRDELKVLRYFIYLAEACYLKAICKRGNVTHIHAHFGTNPAAVAMLCRLIGGPKYSFTVHGPEEFDRPLNLSLSDKIKHADFVVAISHFCQSQLFRWCDTLDDWKKIKIIRCALGEDIFNHRTKIINNKTLIAVGRLSEQKGFPTLLQAASILHQRGVSFKLDIVGDGPMREQLEASIKADDLSEHVNILGYMSGQGVKDKLDSGCALLVPSFAEGLPVVIMEAFARARPVLTTHIAAMTELVDEGITGWLIPAGDAVLLANKMETLLSLDADTLNAMGEAGSKRLTQQHNSKQEAEKLQQLFMGEQP